jgi:hypothetical protein
MSAMLSRICPDIGKPKTSLARCAFVSALHGLNDRQFSKAQ